MKLLHCLNKILVRTILLLIGCSFFKEVDAQIYDTVYFKNGQVLIGKLKSIRLGRVDFDAESIALLSIKSDKIRTISAKRNMFKIETIKKQMFYSMISPSIDGAVEVQQMGGSKVLRISDISDGFALGGESASLWEGDAGVGYSYTRSSDIGRFNADVALKYASRKVELIFKTGTITTQRDSSFSFENVTTNLYASYILSARWQGYILLGFQHNKELGLASRFLEGIATGYTIISSTHSRGKLISGLFLSQEKNLEGTRTPTQLELPVIFTFDFYKFQKPDMTISLTQSVIAGITQSGRFRQDGQIRLSWKVISDLSISIQMYNNYDNMPPTENSSKVDYGVVFGLNYSFSK